MRLERERPQATVPPGAFLFGLSGGGAALPERRVTSYAPFTFYALRLRRMVRRVRRWPLARRGVRRRGVRFIMRRRFGALRLIVRRRMDLGLAFSSFETLWSIDLNIARTHL